MPPAAPDDLIRQQSRIEDDSPFSSDQPRIIPEHETVSKSKKKKSGKKAKAKAAAESPPEEMWDRPLQWDECNSADISPRIISPAPDLPDLPAPPEQPEDPVEPEPSSWPDHDPLLDHHAPPEASPLSPVTSPVLDALGSLRERVETHDLNRRTDTWAKSVPFGKSPPTDLIDAELPQDSPLNFPTIQERGFSQPSSASPPQHPSVDRSKSYSYGSPMSNLAPPPHMPQAHFYGAPDVELPNQPRSVADDAYSFCGFDVLPSLSAKSARGGTTVLVVGMDSRVEIYAVESRRSRLVGQITGLNGRVLDAKILSDSCQSDPPNPSHPHVAIIIHGPKAHDREDGRSSSVASENNETLPTPSRGEPDRRSTSDVPFYQTRVEVYSLRSGNQVATLFAGKPVPAMEFAPGLPSLAPPPVGSLKIQSSGKHIIVASGISGEVYVYRQTLGSTYQCLGKTWTSVQTGETRRYSTSSSSTDPDGSHLDSARTAPLEDPILGIQGRWLAIAPPSNSSKESIRGQVPAEIWHDRAEGIASRNAPTMPSVNCATDVGEGESFFDKFARGVTQEFVKGARWMGDQGMQAWSNYWKPQQPPGTSPQRPVRASDSPNPSYGAFPPTHAQDTQSSSPAEADTVSIIDLKQFGDGADAKSASLQPVATFQVPNGCSFLSLSPNGLMLFTASKKGDVQYVWDLMQFRHCRAMNMMADNFSYPSANVRQVARYARLTASSIMDVIWAGPAGDRLAIITRKGTIHVYDLPRSAFQWPPFRRARPVAKSPTVDPASDELPGQSSGGNPLSAAIKLVGGGFALPAAAGIKGGKVVAAGLSKSMGAAATGTVHTLRHVGENRVHLTGLARDPAAARVVWILSKGLIYLGAVDDGIFKLYRLKLGPTSHKNRQFHSIIGGKEVQYKLPACLQSHCGPALLSQYDPNRTVQGSLIMPSVGTQHSYTGRHLTQPLSQAEIETNTPYQPFHTDQRVGLHVFNVDNEVTDPTLSSPGKPWVFGGDIPVTKIHVRSYNNSGEDGLADDEQEDAAIHGHSFGAGGDMENLISLANSAGQVEEVVITTRRKKKQSSPSKTEEEIFEDDCEVLDFARDRV
ncbi:hypothetical protein N7470_008042 [Penicillium chermesinum]|nr:hypothetical protein N7470_008042 [Penicillium chermesinum]